MATGECFRLVYAVTLRPAIVIAGKAWKMLQAIYGLVAWAMTAARRELRFATVRALKSLDQALKWLIRTVIQPVVLWLAKIGRAAFGLFRRTVLAWSLHALVRLRDRVIVPAGRTIGHMLLAMGRKASPFAWPAICCTSAVSFASNAVSLLGRGAIWSALPFFLAAWAFMACTFILIGYALHRTAAMWMAAAANAFVVQGGRRFSRIGGGLSLAANFFLQAGAWMYCNMDFSMAVVAVAALRRLANAVRFLLHHAVIGSAWMKRCLRSTASFLQAILRLFVLPCGRTVWRGFWSVIESVWQSPLLALALCAVLVGSAYFSRDGGTGPIAVSARLVWMLLGAVWWPVTAVIFVAELALATVLQLVRLCCSVPFELVKLLWSVTVSHILFPTLSLARIGLGVLGHLSAIEVSALSHFQDKSYAWMACMAHLFASRLIDLGCVRATAQVARNGIAGEAVLLVKVARWTVKMLLLPLVATTFLSKLAGTFVVYVIGLVALPTMLLYFTVTIFALAWEVHMHRREDSMAGQPRHAAGPSARRHVEETVLTRTIVTPSPSPPVQLFWSDDCCICLGTFADVVAGPVEPIVVNPLPPTYEEGAATTRGTVQVRANEETMRLPAASSAGGGIGSDIQLGRDNEGILGNNSMRAGFGLPEGYSEEVAAFRIPFHAARSVRLACSFSYKIMPGQFYLPISLIWHAPRNLVLYDWRSATGSLGGRDFGLADEPSSR